MDEDEPSEVFFSFVGGSFVEIWSLERLEHKKRKVGERRRTRRKIFVSLSKFEEKKFAATTVEEEDGCGFSSKSSADELEKEGKSRWTSGGKESYWF